MRTLPAVQRAQGRWWPFIVAALLLFLASAAEAAPFSFFNTITTSYQKGEIIPVMVGPMTSRKKLMPMPWRSLKRCEQRSRGRKRGRNIGQILFGDELEESQYELRVLENQTCVPLCSVVMSKADKNYLMKLISGQYRGNVYIDDLPGMESVVRSRGSSHITTGFHLGLTDVSPHKAIVYNHLIFTISYYRVDSLFSEKSSYCIVQVQLSARSIQYAGDPCIVHEPSTVEPQPVADKIPYSYSVQWVESNVSWSTRWDVFMKVTGREAQVHWFSILNFFFVMLLQTSSLWYILVRALRRDINYYNDPDLEDKEETGWKLVHGDVFRRPRGAGVLSILAGTGVQLALMGGSTLCIACMGFISPQSHGLLLTTLILLFVLFSFINGLVTALLIKFFKMRSWKIIISTGFFYPGQMFLAYFLLNFIHLGSHAASTASFTAILILLLLWHGVSTPLVILGATAGFNINLSVPVKVNNIPRTIPPAPWYLDSALTVFLPGLVPFAASHVEMSYIFGSVWHGAVYYMFGFLLAVYLLTVVIAAQTSVFATYIQLNRLNYHWWWRSFLTSASYGIWIFLYSILYYFRYSTLGGFLSAVLFFGYMGMVSYTLCVLSGAVGFLASFVFVRIIYSNVKVD